MAVAKRHLAPQVYPRTLYGTREETTEQAHGNYLSSYGMGCPG
jgi:hypothetical protein